MLEGSCAGNVLGSGSHGTVYKGMLKGIPVAVKVVCYKGVDHARDEILSSLVLKHVNLVRTYMAFQRKLPTWHSAGQRFENPAEWMVDRKVDISDTKPMNFHKQQAEFARKAVHGFWDDTIRDDARGCEQDEVMYECCFVQVCCHSNLFAWRPSIWPMMQRSCVAQAHHGLNVHDGCIMALLI
jgi:hypothetical protein